MDKITAAQAVETADAAADRADGQGRISVGLFVFLGVLEAGAVMAQGLVPGRRGITLFMVAVMPLIMGNVYLGTRSTTARYNSTLHPILLACATAFATVTFTFGRGFFQGSSAWWTVGGVVSGIPFVIIAVLEIRRRRRRSVRTRATGTR